MTVRPDELDSVMAHSVPEPRHQVGRDRGGVEDAPTRHLVDAGGARAETAQHARRIEGLVPVLPDDPDLSAGKHVHPTGCRLAVAIRHRGSILSTGGVRERRPDRLILRRNAMAAIRRNSRTVPSI